MSRRYLTAAGLALAPVLAVAALSVAPASALGAPAVTSVSPNEGGSNGAVKVIIHGTGFTGVETKDVLYAGVELTLTATSPAPKGDFRVISETEIEINTPFHEHAKTFVEVCTGAKVECSSATREPSNEFQIWDEVYKNETVIGSGHLANIGYGEILLNSPQIETQIECVNVGFGAGWNEALKGRTAISGHGEILVWWASGHTPKGTHTELSSRCRFVDEGHTENQPTSPIAWATAEPPLHEEQTQGEICISKEKTELSKCPIKAGEPGEEREIVKVIRAVTREPISLPWNIQFTEKSEKPHIRVGVPDICKATEKGTELSRCPEASEREPSQNPEACTAPLPDPPGCIKVQILSNPTLNVHQEYEGYNEPKGTNGGPNGLTPGSWEFEGSPAGEPALHLRETPTTEGSTTGSVKIIGFSGQELVSVK